MTPTIYPVILPVPAEGRSLPPKERVRFLSRHAREALRLSAERLNVLLGPLEKDARGAPIPSNGHFWSITHSTHYVAGVAAPAAVGIDLERIRPVSEGMSRMAAGESEWALAGVDLELAFFRFWTAKEAVLKTRGEGIKDLSRCRIVRISDSAHLQVDYTGERWPVEQLFFDGHVAALAVQRLRVEWTFAK